MNVNMEFWNSFLSYHLIQDLKKKKTDWNERFKPNTLYAITHRDYTHFIELDHCLAFFSASAAAATPERRCPRMCRHKSRSDAFKEVQGFSWVEMSTRRKGSHTLVYIWSVWLVHQLTKCSSKRSFTLRQVLKNTFLFVLLLFLFLFFFNIVSFSLF